MSRRTSQEEPGFGSDSFLDIVANLVGILIILIVLAGLRAGQVPVAEELLTSIPSVQVTEPEETEESKAKRAEQQAREREAREQQLEEQRRLADERRQRRDERWKENERRTRLLAEADRLKAARRESGNRIRALQDSLNQTNVESALSALETRQARHREVLGQAKTLNATLSRVRGEGRQIIDQLGQESQELDRLKAQLDSVNEELEALIATRPEKEMLPHRVTPVGRIVLGDEAHFRVSAGRISVVPVDELTQILRDRIRENGPWLMRQPSHSGHVGPIEGYRMHYTVVREVMSIVNELRVGSGVMRINVREFSIHPARGLVEQTIDEALEDDGLFFEALRRLSPETTLTLWVYPDSFGDYRRLASFAQQNGFIVAGRPLPKGMPISGSPHGSRSVGQ